MKTSQMNDAPVSTLFWAWTRSAPSPKTKRRPQKWADKSPKKDTQRSTHWNLERPHPSDDDEEENKTNNRIRKNIVGHFHGSVPFVFGQGLVLAPHPKDPSRADAIVADQTFFFSPSRWLGVPSLDREYQEGWKASLIRRPWSRRTQTVPAGSNGLRVQSPWLRLN